MNISNKRFLVIGGAGFIGSHVVKELLKHDVKEVIIYDNFSRGKKDYIAESLNDERCKLYENGGDIREVDLLDDAMKNIDGVFLLAAMWLLHCQEFPRTAFDVNIGGTYNVLEACAKNNVKRLIYSSSASVYGDAQFIPMTEDHPFNNRNFYGSTKISGETMCRSTYDRYGLDYVALRYMNVYGPHQDQKAAYTGVIPTLFNMIAKNASPQINGDGSQSYDFISVEDVARCNILAMQANCTDRAYNVGTGVSTSIKDLCDKILSLKSSDLKVEYRPYSADDSRRLVQHRLACTKKAEQDLGFKFSIDIDDGLKRLDKWRLDNGY